jgi:hypothetical protein
MAQVTRVQSPDINPHPVPQKEKKFQQQGCSSGYSPTRARLGSILNTQKK